LLSINGPSVICHDPSGQQLQWSANHFIEIGSKVFVLDFNDPAGSDGINVLDFIQSPSEAGIMAAHLVRASMRNDAPDKFWERASSSFIRQLICLVLRMPAEFRNMANVRHLLTALAGEPKAIDKLMAKYAYNALFLEYKALILGNEKTLSSIIMSSQASLSVWESEAVCRLTSKTTIDFEKFRKEKSVLFLKNATFDAIYYRPLLSIILENVIKVFMNRLPITGIDRPVWFVLDETDTLQLKSLDTVLSNNRKYALGFMLFYQSVFQLFKNSQEIGQTILGNCFSKLYLTGADMKTATELEHAIGKTTIFDESGKHKVVPLMPAQKIRMMQSDTALLIAGAHKPFLLEMTPFYKSPFLRNKVGQSNYCHRPIIISAHPKLVALT
jgi:type IV secretory pathway TraG/TraD family ATPase VirD4